MKNEKLIGMIETEIENRTNNRDLEKLKQMTDQQLLTLKKQLMIEREKEYKKMGWIK